MIRILLVDDQPSVLQGLRMRLALEPDVQIVGEADNGQTALDLASRLYPDVVVMDVEMPVLDGITALSQLRALRPRSHVVVLTIHDDDETRRRALMAGAHGFVGKHQEVERLSAAIRHAAAN